MTATEVALKDVQVNQRRSIDRSTVNPYEGLVSAVGVAKVRGLHPVSIRVSPEWYAYLAVSLPYQHEYIEEESVTYLVLRCPERVLIYTDRELPMGYGVMNCRSPDCAVEVILAS